MTHANWTAALKKCLEKCLYADHHRLVAGTNMYCVRTFDKSSLLFSIPLKLSHPAGNELQQLGRGSDGAVGLLIEEIKTAARTCRALHPIGGLDTEHPARFSAMTEPVTLIHSPGEIGADLWKAGTGNILLPDGLHLEVRGAIPYPGPPDQKNTRAVHECLSRFIGALREVIESVPGDRLEYACRRSIDQKALREQLPGMGLVSFIGDGSRMARQYTRHRCHFRIAGPKSGVHIPFDCPAELEPLEIELRGTGETATGLGIRRSEIFAIVGSNAEGKSTVLQAVIAGEDDHAEGDGREHIVTLRGAQSPQVGSYELAGADISLFFDRLPPGLTGEAKAAYGHGSGSMVMAQQFQIALSRKTPCILLDEDRCATNLLVPSCVQSEGITPLSKLLARDRSRLNGASLVIATGAMDFLAAHADRIMMLEQHTARGIETGAFRKTLQRHLLSMAGQLDATNRKNNGWKLIDHPSK